MVALFESTSIDSQHDSLLNQVGLYTSSTLATVTLHRTIASWMRTTLMEGMFLIIVLSVDRLAGCCIALGFRPSDLRPVHRNELLQGGRCTGLCQVSHFLRTQSHLHTTTIYSRKLAPMHLHNGFTLLSTASCTSTRSPM